jgi:predicted transcriptional regulator
MMTTTTIRVSLQTQHNVRRLAAQAGISMQEIVEQAVELYRRKQLLEAANAAYAAVRSQPAKHQALHAELAEWDTTLADGLPED